MKVFGIDRSYAAGINWKNGLRDLDISSIKKLNFDETYLNSHHQKVAQYLEKEPRFERVKNFKQALSFNAFLFSKLMDYSDEQRVVLGGDHAIAMATVEASLAELRDGQKLNIVWIDAHGDYNSPESSPSGNIHGMPLYYLLNSSSFKKRINKVFLIGTSSIDAEEQLLLDKDDRVINIAHDKFENVDQIKHLIKREGSAWGLHISFDIDALALSEAPGTGCQIEEGLHWGMVKSLFNVLLTEQQVKGIDIVEYNPDLDQEKKTRDIVLELLELIKHYKPEKNTPSRVEIERQILLSKKNHLQSGLDYIM